MSIATQTDDSGGSVRGRATWVRWAVTAVAAIASMLALDAVATTAGVVLVATNVLAGASIPALVAVLATTYLAWAAALRVNLVANWCLLEATGTSTNAVSKLCFDAARRRGWTRRAARTASAAGYVGVEAAMEFPYFAGAFGSALLSDRVDASDAIVFLAGTNVGAAVYVLALARLTRGGLAWRSRRVGRVLTSTSVGTAA